MDAAGLRQLIVAFVQHGSRDDLIAAVRARPELLTEEADAAFGALQAEWQRAGSPLATTTQAHRRALGSLRAAAMSTPDGRATALTRLGHRHLDEFERTADPNQLSRAEAAYRAALDDTPAGSEREPGRLSHLASALLHRWRRDGDALALDEALRLLETTGSGSGVALNNLGSALLELFERDGGDALDRAIDAFERAARLEKPGTEDHRLTVENLETARRRRHGLRGGKAPESPEADVAAARAALATAGAARRPALLADLGAALSAFYDATGDVRALEELVRAYEEAVAATSPGSPRLPTRLANLGDALRDRHIRIGTAADLERAVDLLDRALELTPPHAPARPDRLAASAVARLERFHRGRASDLPVAVERAEAALTATEPASPDRAARLGLLAGCLQEVQASLDLAVALFGASLAATPPDDPMYARHLHNLRKSRRGRRVRAEPEVLQRLEFLERCSIQRPNPLERCSIPSRRCRPAGLITRDTSAGYLHVLNFEGLGWVLSGRSASGVH